MSAGVHGVYHRHLNAAYLDRAALVHADGVLHALCAQVGGELVNGDHLRLELFG